ncbi:MAG: hypothetical protein JHC28_04295 [Thermoprotei archaeon]|nr:hypothetical protein [Thermoprotei archaeon]
MPFEKCLVPLMDIYRGFGLTLMVASIVVAAFTYFLVGLIPIAALFVGLSVVGASMLLTPSYPDMSKGMSFLLFSWLDSVSAFLEAFRLGSHSLFIAQGNYAYVLISSKEISKPQFDPAATPIIWEKDAPILIFKSPINKEMLEEGSICALGESIITDQLDLADRVECYEDRGVVSLGIFSPHIKDPRRAITAFGGTYGLIIGSIAALLKGRSKVEYVEEGGGYLLVKVKTD